MRLRYVCMVFSCLCLCFCASGNKGESSDIDLDASVDTGYKPPPVCTPTTSCAAEGRSCGTVDNGCSIESCGGCSDPSQACNEDGLCYCAGNLECQIGQCGDIPPGVCGDLNCGTCPGSQFCTTGYFCTTCDQAASMEDCQGADYAARCRWAECENRCVSRDSYCSVIVGCTEGLCDGATNSGSCDAIECCSWYSCYPGEENLASCHPTGTPTGEVCPAYCRLPQFDNQPACDLAGGCAWYICVDDCYQVGTTPDPCGGT
ncbi:MAG: hypothetical protein IPJ88_05815 [Myxococcales bacterium]|nr:MAG: hypothetical protein IPJ88_05815 [Myxococcales bacterium]